MSDTPSVPRDVEDAIRAAAEECLQAVAVRCHPILPGASVTFPQVFAAIIRSAVVPLVEQRDARIAALEVKSTPELLKARRKLALRMMESLSHEFKLEHVWDGNKAARCIEQQLPLTYAEAEMQMAHMRSIDNDE